MSTRVCSSFLFQSLKLWFLDCSLFKPVTCHLLFIFTSPTQLSFDMVVNQFSNIEKVDWVFYNTFYKLEEKWWIGW
ncbi:unnamed protein product, partial [Vitis vinifera]|uniref:Uncharacterized protein n=1 Tax=Vitis vinifera TaxID=29760 RepID=D7TRD7_VITVI